MLGDNGGDDGHVVETEGVDRDVFGRSQPRSQIGRRIWGDAALSDGREHLEHFPDSVQAALQKTSPRLGTANRTVWPTVCSKTEIT